MRRTPTTIRLTAVLVAPLTLAACGASATEQPPTAHETTATAEPSPTTPEVALPAGLVLSGVVENDGDGDYARVTLTDDSPLLTYDPALVEPDVLESFAQADVEEAQRIAARFTVEEGLDSILVASDRVEDWRAANGDKFDPEWVDLDETLAARDQGAVLGALVDNDVADRREYDLALDGGPRISDFEAALTQVFVAPNGDLAFAFEGELKRPAISPEGEPFEEVMEFTETWALYRSDDGRWLITGWDNHHQYP